MESARGERCLVIGLGDARGVDELQPGGGHRLLVHAVRADRHLVATADELPAHGKEGKEIALRSHRCDHDMAWLHATHGGAFDFRRADD
jgi:hypothetical protein